MSPTVVVLLILGAGIGAVAASAYTAAGRRVRRVRSRVRRLRRARLVLTTAPARRRGARR